MWIKKLNLSLIYIAIVIKNNLISKKLGHSDLSNNFFLINFFFNLIHFFLTGEMPTHFSSSLGKDGGDM